MGYQHHAPGHAPQAALDDADPLERLRLRYGAHTSYASYAMVDSHPAIESAWFQADAAAGVGIIELWFLEGASRAVQSAAARAAFAVLRAWYPDLSSWDVRARPGRERPDPRAGHLGPRRAELDLLARARAKRLRSAT
ncbi:MAG TPA: hypothetical protein VLC09_20145 [Polyangiaceae bacterium]|nr:hypothetical protein [Polyangiaceae bacterium]